VTQRKNKSKAQANTPLHTKGQEGMAESDTAPIPTMDRDMANPARAQDTTHVI